METVDNYLEIKHRLKTKYGLDLVITQSGPFFEALEEDAESMEQELGWTLRQRGEYSVCSAPATGIIENFLLRKLKELGFNFAILRLIQTQDQTVVREVVHTTNDKVLGLKFGYKDEKEDISNFLQAVLNGADPITGEILNENSVWKHPKIIADIKHILDEEEL